MSNVYNKLITSKDVENIINKYLRYPISIANISLFVKAFTHTSFCVIDQDFDDTDNYCVSYNIKRQDNEKLEFLGDKVIDFITAEFLYNKYADKEDQGFLTKLKSRIVKKETLSMLGEKLGFKKFILINSHIEKIDGRNNPRFLEDIFESFMCALYKDTGNLEVCKDFLLGVYSEFIDLDYLITNNDNYKDSLLRYFHSLSLGHPVYTCIYYTGPVNNRKFVTIVKLPKNTENIKVTSNFRELKELIDLDFSSKNNLDVKKFIKENIVSELENCIIVGYGIGYTKKESEQDCSKNCLKRLNISFNY